MRKASRAGVPLSKRSGHGASAGISESPLGLGVEGGLEGERPDFWGSEPVPDAWKVRPGPLGLELPCR